MTAAQRTPLLAEEGEDLHRDRLRNRPRRLWADLARDERESERHTLCIVSFKGWRHLARSPGKDRMCRLKTECLGWRSALVVFHTCVGVRT